MKHTTHNNQNKDKKHKRKALFLWIFLPLGLLTIAGATVGGLAAAGMFRAGTKIDIKDIFSASNKWTTPPSGTSYTEDGYTYNTNTTGVSKPTIDDILTYLDGDDYLFNPATGQKKDNKDVLNILNITIPGSPSDNAWCDISVAANSKTRKYEGSIHFYLFIQNHATSKLKTDLQTKAIDLSSNSANVSVDSGTLYNGIKNTSGNGNLNINAIKLEYYDGSTWKDWTWAQPGATETNKFGIGTTNTNQATSLTCWNIANDRYEKIRIAPGGINPNYYTGGGADNDPIEISLKLYRSDITSVTDWKKDWDTIYSEFRVDPSEDSYFAHFDEAYDQAAWYKGKLDDNTSTGTGNWLGTWSFPKIGNTAEGAIFNIKGNPFYNTYEWTAFSGVTAGYVFSWHIAQPEKLINIIKDNTGTQITTLSNIFYQTPIRDDVIAVLDDMVPSSNTISWNQINITIDSTNKTITLAGISGSLSYTTDTDVISYTLRTN